MPAFDEAGSLTRDGLMRRPEEEAIASIVASVDQLDQNARPVCGVDAELRPSGV
jgi:hypothetical protein